MPREAEARLPYLVDSGVEMSCWYCHWGWAKPVADIYDEAVRQLGGDDSVLHWSAGHVVWEDENFDSADWCLKHFDEYTTGEHGGYDEKSLKTLRWSLEELDKLPYEVRCISPEDRDENFDYGDKGVEDFPPDVEVVMR